MKVFPIVVLSLLLIVSGCKKPASNNGVAGQDQEASKIAGNNSDASEADVGAIAGTNRAKETAEQLTNLFLMDGFYSDGNISFSYPSESEKNTMETAAGPAFIIYLPGGDGINVTMLTQDLETNDEPITLDDITKIYRTDFGTQIANPGVISEGECEIDGHPAYERKWHGPVTMVWIFTFGRYGLLSMKTRSYLGCRVRKWKPRRCWARQRKSLTRSASSYIPFKTEFMSRCLRLNSQLD